MKVGFGLIHKISMLQLRTGIMKKKVSKTNLGIIDYLAILTCFIWTVVGIVVSLNRYWQYEVYYIDFGIFDQAIWEVAHFKPPIIEHFLVSGKWIFADHFNPSIFLLSPLYWFTDRSEILLIAQAVCVGLSAYILYLIAKELLENSYLSIGVLVSYLLFVGLQNAVITEFHEITIMPLFFMLTIWAILKKRIYLYFVMLIIVLGFKESLFTMGIGIGIAIFFIQRKWWKIGLITVFISAVWGYIAIKYIIPSFSNGLYIYSPSLP